MATVRQSQTVGRPPSYDEKRMDTQREAARSWLDLAIKAAAVIALVGYAAKRDQQIADSALAIVELRAVSSDLARGVAVSTARLDALDDRISTIERRTQ